MDTATYQIMTSFRNELAGLMQRFDAALKQQNTEPDPEKEKERYEDWRRNDIINQLTEKMKSRQNKNINIHSVEVWANLPENFIRQKLYPRNPNRTSTFWALDVMKFLCDLWQKDYPEVYIKTCKKEGINPKTGNNELK